MSKTSTSEGWNLFLDDIRDPSYINDGRKYYLARTMAQACGLVILQGLPNHISFDHDLGWDTLPTFDNSILLAPPGKELPSGYDFAKWLVESDIDGEIDIPESFTWSIHSSNPVGSANINGILTSYMKHKFNKDNT